MLTVQGRAASGAQGILRTLSAMTEDAITAEVAVVNPFRGVRVRGNDPRVQKPGTEVRVFSWEQMHKLAAAAPEASGTVDTSRVPPEWLPSMLARMERAARHRALVGEPSIRVLSDCGLRVGEMLALTHADVDLKNGVLNVRRSVSGGVIHDGTKSGRIRGNVDSREVPVPPGLGAILNGMLGSLPSPIRPENGAAVPELGGEPVGVHALAPPSPRAGPRTVRRGREGA
jgi:integrase